MSTPLLDPTQRSLRRLALDRQRKGRVPATYLCTRGPLAFGESP